VWTDGATAQLAPDAWDPDDMLLAPLRGFGGELLGVLSVDRPQSGRRPDDEEITTLMAVAEYTGLLLAGPADRPGGHEPMLDAVMLLAETLDLRDAGTAAHSRTVGRYVRDTAVALGFAEDDVAVLHAAGVLHDLGKLAVPDAILHKPGRLTDAEWAEIRRHPEVGARILENAGLHRIAGWVRAHHERVDGTGYPNQLRVDQIPLEARILAVADAYEAMTADRPYRPGMDREAARDELRRCAGTQFDEAVVAAFLRVVADVPALAA
jgi:HD-GYP domain-containing protein (c-di-GMP phosphodiesterase class II)